MFLDLNGAQRDPDPPHTDDAEAAMLAAVSSSSVPKSVPNTANTPSRRSGPP
jgi:hypothetical protein